MSSVAVKKDAGYDDIGLDSGVLPDTKELPAWAVSLAVHIVLLAVFWMWRMSSPPEVQMEITSPVEEVPKKVEKFNVAQDKMGNDTKADHVASAATTALLKGRDPKKVIDSKLWDENIKPTEYMPEPVDEPSRDELVAAIQTNGNTRDAGGTEGAIDILVREIEFSLRERKTFVVWLFDASQSLNARRNMIADRFDRVYKQLNARNDDVYKRLKTGVVSYGEKTTFLTEEPVDDVKDVVKAVRSIKPDKSGQEFVFTAVGDTLQKWHSKLAAYRSATQMRRNVMFIVVTDERGDDYNGKSKSQLNYLDQVIGQLRRYDIRVYCVGNAAVFGREKGFVSFTDETGYNWPKIAVDQGPETVAPQRLQLPFWGNVPRNIDQLSSSYGPYALQRMVTETNGLYLIAEHSVGAMKFPPDVMRRYRPFYGPIPKYLAGLRSNRAKAALDQAARLSLRESIPRPQTVFRADTETNLRQEISRAQRPLARLNYALGEMLPVMEIGEKDRDKLNEDRWRASFDLAMGRLLATRARAMGYQAVVAEMSVNPKTFTNKKNNQWKLVPSKNWETYPPSVKKVAKKAVMYLKRVIDEHPNTPWALLAEYELGEGNLGWEWQEGYSAGYSRRGNGNNANPILLANENNPAKKKKKKQMNRPKPKL